MFREPLEGLSKQASASMQFPGAEPDSTESSKNADYHSPVSVLEVPFTEDISSSSESFERVSAELHGMQLIINILRICPCLKLMVIKSLQVSVCE